MVGAWSNPAARSRYVTGKLSEVTAPLCPTLQKNLQIWEDLLSGSLLQHPHTKIITVRTSEARHPLQMEMRIVSYVEKLKLKNSVFWDVTPWSKVKLNRSFGGTYLLHRQGRRGGRARNQQGKLFDFYLAIDLYLHKTFSCVIQIFIIQVYLQLILFCYTTTTTTTTSKV
jgi:hypothetical protein